MAAIGSHGSRMAHHFHLKDVPTFTTEASPGATFAVTRLASETAPNVRTTPIPLQSAFVIEWQLGSHSSHELRALGEERTASFTPKESIRIVDLERDQAAPLNAPFDCIHFYLSRISLDWLSEEYHLARVRKLECPRGTIDETVNCLGALLISALAPGGSRCQVSRDTLLVALGTHIVKRYGDSQSTQNAIRGGLAPWQKRRATDLLMANIDGSIPLARLASECHLSASHFARAFKASTGRAPHRWLIEQRVDRSKALLNMRDVPLAEIALRCGFSEQATFNRTFKREVGTSPGVWRRLSQC